MSVCQWPSLPRVIAAGIGRLSRAAVSAESAERSALSAFSGSSLASTCPSSTRSPTLRALRSPARRSGRQGQGSNVPGQACLALLAVTIRAGRISGISTFACGLREPPRDRKSNADQNKGRPARTLFFTGTCGFRRNARAPLRSGRTAAQSAKLNKDCDQMFGCVKQT